MSKDSPSIKIDETNDSVIFTFSKISSEWERFDKKDLARLLQQELVKVLVPRIEHEVFNSVMELVDVKAIAQGVSIRIIQNLSKNPNDRDY